jgi:hypothetical protein
VFERTHRSFPDKRSNYVLDRLAQCYLYLGIVTRDEAMVENAATMYQELIAEAPTSSMRLLLCDAYIWQRKFTEAREQVRALERMRERHESTSKRRRLIARISRQTAAESVEATTVPGPEDMRQLAQDHLCKVG